MVRSLKLSVSGWHMAGTQIWPVTIVLAWGICLDCKGMFAEKTGRGRNRAFLLPDFHCFIPKIRQKFRTEERKHFMKLLPSRKCLLFLTGFPCPVTDPSHSLDTHEGKYSRQNVDKSRGAIFYGLLEL